jgi:hypothetical protein
MNVCVIMHNMIVDNECVALMIIRMIGRIFAQVDHVSVEFKDFFVMYQEIRDEQLHRPTAR